MSCDDKREDINIAAEAMRKAHTGLLLTGRIRNGKLELDKSTLDDIEKKFSNADQAFVAMNSPFDPNPHTAI